MVRQKFVLFITKYFFLHLGMAITEKQGGSDVRANTTKAYCDNSEEKRYILIGHKYEKWVNN